jgi:WD40 repeat protein
MKEKGGPDPVFDVYWSQKEGHNEFVTAGKKHFKWWWPAENKVKKGLYMGNGKATSHACCTFDEDGTAYTGGCNSRIYVWKDRELQKNYRVHDKGFISSILWSGGKIYSGGKDNQVIISNPETEEAERKIEMNATIRAIDVSGSKLIVGLLNGDIVEVNGDDQNRVMESHSKGEAWGLAPIGDDEFVTSGDDNQLKVWSVSDRKAISRGEICDEDAKPKKGAASTLSDLAPSKCARAVAVHPENGHVAVGHNDGRVTVRAGKDELDNVAFTLHDSAEWIEAMAYSPCGKYLAVGSHDNNIYVYAVEGYTLHGTGKAHRSFVVSVDWSQDSAYIRSVCGAHELIWHKVTDDGVEQDPSGHSNTLETEWATNSAKFGWLVTGIFPSGTDGTHINHVDFSADNSLIVTGDDYGLVNVWRNPSRAGHKPISLRGHSEHVVRTRFMQGDNYIISIGGYDKTVFQWKKQ